MTTPAGWHPDPEGSGQQRWWDGQQWTSALQPSATSSMPSGYTSEPQTDPEPGKSKPKKWPWIAGAVVMLLVIIGVATSTDKSSDDTASSQPQTTQATAVTTAPTTTTKTSAVALPTTKAQVVAPAETVTLAPTTTTKPVTTAPTSVTPGMTAGQRNAVRTAKSYLDYTAFSRPGLIEQLEYEDYSTEDATFAVDYVAPDWNKQAAKAAESYLDYTSFSRQGLIDQLMYEGYTSTQAQYGVDQAGL